MDKRIIIVNGSVYFADQARNVMRLMKHVVKGTFHNLLVVALFLGMGVVLFSGVVEGQIFKRAHIFSSHAYAPIDTVNLKGTPITISVDNMRIEGQRLVIRNTGSACNAINITGDSVTIAGSITILGTNINYGVNIAGNDCNISGLTIVNPLKHGIYVNGDRNTINNCLLKADSTIYSGVFIMGSSALTNVSDCMIEGFSYGVEEDDSGTVVASLVTGCQLSKNLIKPSVHFRNGSYSFLVGNKE